MPMAIEADRARGLVYQPGSAVPLLRNLLIFGSHFALRAAQDPALLPWDCAVSGASAGYFAGWGVRFVSSYYQAGPIKEALLF